MKTSVIGVSAYIAAHGVPEARGGSIKPELRALWSRIDKLQPIKNGGGGEYIILEGEAGEDLNRVRHSASNIGRMWMRRIGKETFRIRMMIRRTEHHVILWKEPVAPTEQPHDQPAAAERSNGRDKATRTATRQQAHA